MDEIEKRYEMWGLLGLKLTGLWPTQKKSKRYMSIVIATFFMMKFMAPMVLHVFKNPSDVMVFFETLMYFLLCVITMAKYIAAVINFNRVKALLLAIDEVKQQFTDRFELELMKKFERDGYFLSRVYAILMFVANSVHNMVPFVPLLLDFIFPLKSGPRNIFLPYKGEFIWFKQEDYHYLLCIAYAVDVAVFLPIYVGIESVYTSTVREICGLFAIVWFERSVTKDGQSASGISAAVKLYTDCIRCVEFLEYTYSIPIFITQLSCLLMFSLCCIYVLFLNEEVLNGLRFGTFGIGILVHLWYYFWIGQLLINSSLDVHFSVYSSNWYKTSTKLQRMIVISSTRTLHPCFITSGKLNPLCLESFGAILKTISSTISVMLAVL